MGASPSSRPSGREGAPAGPHRNQTQPRAPSPANRRSLHPAVHSWRAADAGACSAYSQRLQPRWPASVWGGPMASVDDAPGTVLRPGTAPTRSVRTASAGSAGAQCGSAASGCRAPESAPRARERGARCAAACADPPTSPGDRPAVPGDRPATPPSKCPPSAGAPTAQPPKAMPPPNKPPPQTAMANVCGEARSAAMIEQRGRQHNRAEAQIHAVLERQYIQSAPQRAQTLFDLGNAQCDRRHSCGTPPRQDRGGAEGGQRRISAVRWGVARRDGTASRPPPLPSSVAEAAQRRGPRRVRDGQSRASRIHARRLEQACLCPPGPVLCCRFRQRRKVRMEAGQRKCEFSGVPSLG